MDLHLLRRTVESEIENYQCPSSPNSIGTPWSDQKIATELAVMRAAILEPYWVEVELRDTLEQIDAERETRRACVVVADDRDGTLLAFDPTENRFVLVVRCETGLITIGVRGDAVGCLMAR
jgi:hypothetical protein